MFRTRPIQRVDAAALWMIMLIAFGVSVVGTRLYLEAAGYPQIGSGTLHIAHVLWGGLLQFIALCVFLTYANRWTRGVSALLGGAGVGLFIDEVGKFITQNNDYFFPFAAPIIYAVLLLTAVLTFHLRRSRPRDSRANLYWILDQLKDVVDQDFDAHERDAVIAALRGALARAKSDSERQLTEALITLVERAPVIAPPKPNVFQRLYAALTRLEARLLSQRRLRWLLVAGFLLIGMGGVLVLLTVASFYGVATDLDQFLAVLIVEFSSTSPQRFQWGLVHVVLTMITGLMCTATAILLALRRDAAGINLGRLTLILELTVVNLLAFYFRQFAMIFATLNVLIVLLGVERYRARFYQPVLKTASIDDVRKRLPTPN
ncbi:MAG: hypothetical protein L6Q98_09260 [Anaerolineae bacterium]|nr:hypothetical protein [Anaerolineae bacterium]NUQ06223.1 hypothetical protein [Anaerolineae bacterium]